MLGAILGSPCLWKLPFRTVLFTYFAGPGGVRVSRIFREVG